MIVGIGVDIVDIARFTRSLERTPRLRERLFTPNERALALPSLAARFAAKEALIKALGGSDGVRWNDVEIASNSDRQPRFVSYRVTEQHLRERGVDRVHVSLSHDAGAAIAFVVVEQTRG